VAAGQFEVSLPEAKKGLIIVHTGPGKGKTTAALGTALRAIGQGLKVLMVQFIKGSWHYGELDAAQMLGEKHLKILPMGRGFVKLGAKKPDPEDVRLVEEAWRFASEKIAKGEYDLVILDEINYAIHYRMLDPEVVVKALKEKPEMMHVILTGRNAHPAIVACADLVTDMREVKHPYHQGVPAQRGIEY
jgi:cob(I)alamin adenosyltransferase